MAEYISISMGIGGDKYFVWDYNEKSDILNIHKRGKKVDGSAEFSDFSVDFDKNRNIVGVEITYASEFLNQIGIQKNQLAEIKSAEITVNKRNNYALVWVKLSVPVTIGTVLSEAITEKKLPLPVPVVA